MDRAAQAELQSNFVPSRLGAPDSRWRLGPPEGRVCPARSTCGGKGRGAASATAVSKELFPSLRTYRGRTPRSAPGGEEQLPEASSSLLHLLCRTRGQSFWRWKKTNRTPVCTSLQKEETATSRDLKGPKAIVVGFLETGSLTAYNTGPAGRWEGGGEEAAFPSQCLAKWVPAGDLDGE